MNAGTIRRTRTVMQDGTDSAASPGVALYLCRCVCWDWSSVKGGPPGERRTDESRWKKEKLCQTRSYVATRDASWAASFSAAAWEYA